VQCRLVACELGEKGLVEPEQPLAIIEIVEADPESQAGNGGRSQTRVFV